MFSREQRKTQIDVKCPKCGKVRGVKIDTIVHWAKRTNKKFEDYANETICFDCTIRARGGEIRGVHPNEMYEVKCCKCGKTRKVKGITLFYWMNTHNISKEEFFKTNQCRSCTVMYGKNGKGGVMVGVQGYRLVMVKPEDPFYCMRQQHKVGWTSGEYVLEHRYVMAKVLGRPLQIWECVHHKDGNKINNASENLQIVNRKSHVTVGIQSEKEKQYIDLIVKLRKENEELKSQIPT